jgi:hypothetical protein
MFWFRPSATDEWSHQNEMRLLARNFLKDPHLLIVNPAWPRAEIIQPRLKQSVVEIMLGPRADAAILQRVRAGLDARGLKRVSLKELAAKVKEAGLAHPRTGRDISVSTLHMMLRHRIYTGEYEWRGRLYKGKHQPIITRELFSHVQGVLDGRHARKTKKGKKEFAFTGLMTCGHCGWRRCLSRRFLQCGPPQEADAGLVAGDGDQGRGAGADNK